MLQPKSLIFDQRGRCPHKMKYHDMAISLEMLNWISIPIQLQSKWCTVKGLVSVSSWIKQAADHRKRCIIYLEFPVGVCSLSFSKNAKSYWFSNEWLDTWMRIELSYLKIPLVCLSLFSFLLWIRMRGQLICDVFKDHWRLSVSTSSNQKLVLQNHYVQKSKRPSKHAYYSMVYSPLMFRHTQPKVCL